MVTSSLIATFFYIIIVKDYQGIIVMITLTIICMVIYQKKIKKLHLIDKIKQKKNKIKHLH